LQVIKQITERDGGVRLDGVTVRKALTELRGKKLSTFAEIQAIGNSL
jgi:hypothetical protein